MLLYVRHPKEQWCSLLSAPRTLQTTNSEHLRVGIIGGGHLGKQLALCLRDLSGLQAHDIRISTRRPETLRELQQLGVQCIYNNVELTVWAQVLFLCCLPSQLPSVCADIRNQLRDDSIVYSLVSAVPLSRLKQLLSHRNIVRPDFHYEIKDVKHDWEKKGPIAACLRDASVLTAMISTGPQQGGVHIVGRWIESAVYAALNMCRVQGLSHQQSLNVLNTLIQKTVTREEDTCYPILRKEDFVTQDISSALSEDSPFPWFDLSSVQVKETTFSQNLENVPRIRECFEQLYLAAFGVQFDTIKNNLALSSKDPS
ncbi:NADP-dependent oxidoreductase domain-containing protein 1 [Discoglossus pictus]